MNKTLKKIGYFFFGFVPILSAFAFQLIALVFLLGLSSIGLILKGDTLSSGIQSLFSSLTDVNFNAEISIIYSLLSIWIFGFMYHFFFHGNFKPDAKRIFSKSQFLGIALAVPMTQLICSLLSLLVTAINPVWMENYEKLMETAGLSDSISVWMFIYAVLLAPIGEELMFRGVSMRCYRAVFPFWLANIIQAFLFGFFHLNMIQGVYAFFIGLILGYVCEKSGSIYYAIFFHMCFNLMGCTTSLLSFLPEEGTVFLALVEYILFPILGIIGIRLYRKGSRKHNYSFQ